MAQVVMIEDKTSPGVLRPSELKQLVEALQHQAGEFNESPWVEHGYCKPIEVKELISGAPPAGAYNLILLDDTSVKGALGFHEDENGTNIPVSYCTVKEAREDDVAPSEVASHELLEMVVDPHVESENEVRTVEHNENIYIVEIADPLEGYGYKAPNGADLANWVNPKYFDLPQTRLALIHRAAPITSSFELPDTGYISIKKPGQEWTQIFGFKRTSLPPWADRLLRIEKPRPTVKKGMH
jgi:hypothetical protein